MKSLSSTEKDTILSTETITKVKSTVPAFRKNSADIVVKLYHTLFQRYPDLKRYLNM